MRKARWLVGTVLWITLLGTPAPAEPIATMEGFVEAYDATVPSARDYLDGYIKGVGYGLQAANAFLHHDQRRQLYCQPAKIAFTGDQLLEIARRFIHDQPAYAAAPVHLALAAAMIDAFPCPVVP